MTPTLETARLILRPRRIDDADAMLATMSDERSMRWWSHAPVASLEELRERFSRDTPGWHRWAITMVGDDRAIGTVGAGEKRQGGVSEIGYMLAMGATGRGIAREAVSAVIDHLFASGQRRVFADTDPENLPSNRLLERLGFRLEGVLRGEWETHQGVRDSLIWGLLREEWRHRTPA